MPLVSVRISAANVENQVAISFSVTIAISGYILIAPDLIEKCIRITSHFIVQKMKKNYNLLTKNKKKKTGLSCSIKSNQLVPLFSNVVTTKKNKDNESNNSVIVVDNNDEKQIIDADIKDFVEKIQNQI